MIADLNSFLEIYYNLRRSFEQAIIDDEYTLEIKENKREDGVSFYGIRIYSEYKYFDNKYIDSINMAIRDRGCVSYAVRYEDHQLFIDIN